MPVLPLVGSTMVAPGVRRPLRSASSIIARQMRSLTLPPGLNDSSLAQTSAESAGTMRCKRTTGVLPTRSSSDSAVTADDDMSGR